MRSAKSRTSSTSKPSPLPVTKFAYRDAEVPRRAAEFHGREVAPRLLARRARRGKKHCNRGAHRNHTSIPIVPIVSPLRCGRSDQSCVRGVGRRVDAHRRSGGELRAGRAASVPNTAPAIMAPPRPRRTPPAPDVAPVRGDHRRECLERQVDGGRAPPRSRAPRATRRPDGRGASRPRRAALRACRAPPRPRPRARGRSARPRRATIPHAGLDDLGDEMAATHEAHDDAVQNPSAPRANLNGSWTGPSSNLDLGEDE